MPWRTIHNPRRAEIRRNRPDKGRFWQRMRAEGVVTSVAIAIGFWVIASGIVMLREHVVPYRPGQYIAYDIVSRVRFTYKNQAKLTQLRSEARENRPHVFRPADSDIFARLEDQLVALPDKVAAGKVEELEPPLNDVLDTGAITRLQGYAEPQRRAGYDESVRSYIASLRELNLIILGPDVLKREGSRKIEVNSSDPTRREPIIVAARDTVYLPLESGSKNVEAQIRSRIEKNFVLDLQPKMWALTSKSLGQTHVLDEEATANAQNRAADAVPAYMAEEEKPANMVLVQAGEIKEAQWQLLRAENETFIDRLDPAAWKSRFGVLAIVGLVTAVLCGYIAKFQGKIVRNHGRGGAIAALLLAMLLVGQLAGIGSTSFYFFGVAPTILVAMILATAYDQRFAMGVASMHALLVTIGLGQGMQFFLILFVGVLTCCFLLDDIRTRSKLIEVGGATALAMMAATAASGLLAMDPVEFIGRSTLYSGAAGLAVGFVVLGILPFVEKAFRMTTSMSLLEWADASQPLLRRLAMEAPGTYNHSLQVATLAEEASEAIGANSLLCRVAAYYHDIGKINKAEYFVENQIDGQNRHLNLTPSVSLLIIIGHVKDGIELAKEYNLPTSILPFIQQHHGTTLVEFFYHQACTKGQQDPDQPAISEMQYRYPGPKPKSREIAVLMLADAAESATRTLIEPTASRIENLVHDLSMKRFSDGQFDECDLTMRDLEVMERSISKTLMGIYHGRIAYPSTAIHNAPAPVANVAASPAAKSA